nr:MAG TPA: hypothetical protein [Bacteriophage sp.]
MEEKYCKLIKKTIKALDNNDVRKQKGRKRRKQYTETNSTQIARDAVRKYMY